MDFLNFVEGARTCRRFDEAQSLTFKDLEWLLDCARLSPCSRNEQELRYITVNQGDVCQNLVDLCRWAGALKDWKGPAEGEKPTAFIALLAPEESSARYCYDVGIACQTINLAAHSRGWGACIILSFDHVKTTALLQPPQGLKINLLIALGVEAEKRAVAQMPADGSFDYWRDAQGVHHVPKRSLAELIVGKF